MIHKLQNLISFPSPTYTFLVFEGECMFILIFHMSWKPLCSQDLRFSSAFIKTLYLLWVSQINITFYGITWILSGI